MFKNLVHTAKKTQHFAFRKKNSLLLFREIIDVYCDNYTKHVHKSAELLIVEIRWYIESPLGFKGLSSRFLITGFFHIIPSTLSGQRCKYLTPWCKAVLDKNAVTEVVCKFIGESLPCLYKSTTEPRFKVN
jgi:hypothetical protein